MRAALQTHDWESAGSLMREEWSYRRKNIPGITTPLIDRLVTAARRAGSSGAKVCGAGGGGCVVFLVEPGAKNSVTNALKAAGGLVLDAQVAPAGVRIRANGAR
jgi:D-glycero-alpha-D-manno-heptose-7-phosphate kinase